MMSRLLVDVGNSRIKWNCADGAALSTTAAAMRSGDQLPHELQNAWRTLEKPAAVWVVSVAGAAFDERLAQWVKQQWGLTINFARPSQYAHGISTRYSEPQKLGADRWVAMIGAREQAPVCVIDCGTAVTLDVLDAKREHVGGLIMPGLTLMRESLIQRAPGIRAGLESSAENPADVLGRDTVSAVQQGTLHAIVGAVKHSVAQIKTELGPLALWMTGGDAELIQSRLGDEYVYVSDLVLRGLLQIALDEQ